MAEAAAKGKPVNTRVVKQNIGDTPFKFALLVVFCLVVPYLYYAKMIYEWGHANKPAGYKYPEVKQLWMTGVGALSFGMMKEMLDCISSPIFRRLVTNKGDDYAYERKVRKAQTNLSGIFYFSLSTFWGWSMMKDSLWIPGFLGGNNPNASIKGCFEPLFIQTPPGIHCYILFTYGYHVHDFIRHAFFAEVDNDWREMLLHHISALALYPGFIFSNVMGIGVVLAWLHDIADIFANITRLFNIIDWPVTGVVTFIMVMIVWAYTRLMILPTYIYYIITEFRFPDPVAHFQGFVWVELAFLMTMQCLHILWFGMFIKMGYRLIMKGERRDLISTVDQTEQAKHQKKAQ